MDLYSLYYGKSKKKIKTLLMTDSYKKCENYRKARQSSVHGFHEIRLAEDGSDKMYKKSSTVGGNKCNAVPHINRHRTTVRNGYISKDGFQQHT
jgi:hypothetical protein